MHSLQADICSSSPLLLYSLKRKPSEMEALLKAHTVKSVLSQGIGTRKVYKIFIDCFFAVKLKSTVLHASETVAFYS